MTSINVGKLNEQQNKLVVGVIVALVILALIATIWTKMYNSHLLSLTVPDLRQEEQGSDANDSKTFAKAGITFQYPSNWDVKTNSDETATVVELPAIQISVYSKLPATAQVMASQALGSGSESIMTWAGKLGKTSGNYWARVSIDANGTQAPYGERAYITESSGRAVVVTLPTPPYTEGQNRFREAFAVTGK